MRGRRSPGLARDTKRVRLGTLVSSVTYRLPGILAVQVANVDQMSGGRVELGLGTGWFAEEHSAFGIPFPQARFDLLEEQLAIVTGLWATPGGARFSFEGEHYRLEDAPALPKPTQDRLPVIVGGLGERRTPRLAAEFADEHNLPFPALDRIRPLFAALDAAIERAERTRPIVRSAALVTVVGDDEATFARRAAAIGREPAELREHGIAGTRGEVEDRLGAARRRRRRARVPAGARPDRPRPPRRDRRVHGRRRLGVSAPAARPAASAG